METNYKIIDNLIEEIIADKTKFQLTTILLIDMMVESGDCQEYLGFYSRICEALLDENDKVSHEEKEHFVAIHQSLLQIYNGN